MRPFVLVALGLLAAAAPSLASAPAAPSRSDTAIFAGGCFWSMESQFEGVKGVKSVISGYTGGHVSHPSYEQVCTETTGHLESVEITFDPAVITYAQLLDRYWHGIDPTQGDGQFCDRGSSYLSAVFVRDDEQRRLALESKAQIEKSKILHAPIVTTIRPAVAFWPAEEYHQQFARKNPEHYHAYRDGCGRDARLHELWGAAAVKPIGY